MPQPAACEIFICVQTKQVQPLNTNALVRGGPKPPAGTLQAERKGAGFRKQPHLPPQEGSSVHGQCSRHREERPGAEVEGLGTGWMLTAPGSLPPSVLEIQTQS